jgi:porphobilinogen synthase
MSFRPRRLRKNSYIRSLCKENILSPSDFVVPLFVKKGKGIKEKIGSMPDQFRYSIDTLLDEIEVIYKLGIKSVLIFGLSDEKDDSCKEALDDNGIVQESVKKIKKNFPELCVMTDVCVCAYTSHGHCGVIQDKYVDNDASLSILSGMAVSHARAGADFVAPSAMMDFQVAAIREGLDECGFKSTGILAYSAKYYSSFYGPFRDAANSSPQFGDRASYQMDTANRREAIKEMALDVNEGADMIMVKPALSYLDIISDAREGFDIPIVAYNVSGTYSMIKAAAKQGWINETACMMEMLLSIKRSGADLIITYFAKDAIKQLN